MKKLLLTVGAIFIATALNAQFSVWDGSAEPWTKGSGTQNDPYLIENAQQLAYLAVKTNELHYDNYSYHNMYVDTCFLLTVDLDLGGDNGLVWEPIAQDGNSLQTRCFGGNFDGNGHIVTNLQFEDGNGRRYMGLFGHVVGGSIKNITVEGDGMVVPEFNLSGIPAGLGMIVGYGENTIVANCVNTLDVTWEYLMLEMGAGIGGLFGIMSNSTITNCHNFGDIYAPETNTYYAGVCFGGIGGTLHNCEVAYCSNRNYANITPKSGNDNFGQVSCGGIAGRMSGTINYCFNIGDFNVVFDLENAVGVKAAGGIMGGCTVEGSLSVSNSYSVTDISVSGNGESSYLGGILGYADETMTVDVKNCYYLDNIDDNGYGIPKADEDMRTQEFVDLLNAGETVFLMDTNGYLNNGYPVLDWYFEHFNSVDENSLGNTTYIYPNPVKDIFIIHFAKEADCQLIEIHSLDGRLVETFPETSPETLIDISNLTPGIYILKVKTTDGKEYTERIVKE